MNISARSPALDRAVAPHADVDQWAIFGPGIDAMVTTSEAEAHHEYRSLFSFEPDEWHLRLKTGIRVYRFNAHDRVCDDVTFDFADFDEED